MLVPERTDCCSRSACGLIRFNACGHADCGRAVADDVTFSQSRPAADPLSDVASRSLKAHHRLPMPEPLLNPLGRSGLLRVCRPRRASLVGSPGVTPSQSCGSQTSFGAARTVAASSSRHRREVSRGERTWPIARRPRPAPRSQRQIAITRVEGKRQLRRNRLVADREAVVAGCMRRPMRWRLRWRG